jgi:D-alanyl-D-alanine endopeptidase (penicillin-binding protein 7)
MPDAWTCRPTDRRPEIGSGRKNSSSGPFSRRLFLATFLRAHQIARAGRAGPAGHTGRAGGVPLDRPERSTAVGLLFVLSGVIAAGAGARAASAAPASATSATVARTGAQSAPPAVHASGSGHSSHAGPGVKSNVALVIDGEQGETLYSKHEDQVAPIASITKLMTAMVVLDAQLPLDEVLEIDEADVDKLKHTHSRLPVGARLERGELLRIALMSSENRAAAALARNYPGGTEACVEAMNRKALELGMPQTHLADPTGLSSGNVSSAPDLTRMVQAAARYPEIREATTSSSHQVALANGRVLEFHNSNGLVANKSWNIGLSKTGYINEAGRCLVMLAEIAARQVVIVLLDSWGKNTRLGDANRIRHWLEATHPPAGTASGAPGGRSSATGRGVTAAKHAPGAQRH